LGHSSQYDNQQLQYSVTEEVDFDCYEAPFPEFRDQDEYNRFIETRGAFRKKCKNEAERIAKLLADQINQISIDEIYRFTYKFAVAHITDTELNIRTILAPAMKRLRR